MDGWWLEPVRVVWTCRNKCVVWQMNVKTETWKAEVEKDSTWSACGMRVSRPMMHFSFGAFGLLPVECRGLYLGMTWSAVSVRLLLIGACVVVRILKLACEWLWKNCWFGRILLRTLVRNASQCRKLTMCNEWSRDELFARWKQRIRIQWLDFNMVYADVTLLRAGYFEVQMYGPLVYFTYPLICCTSKLNLCCWLPFTVFKNFILQILCVF